MTSAACQTDSDTCPEAHALSEKAQAQALVTQHAFTGSLLQRTTLASAAGYKEEASRNVYIYKF